MLLLNIQATQPYNDIVAHRGQDASLGAHPRETCEGRSMMCSGVCNGAPHSHTGDATILYLCMSAANLVRPDSNQPDSNR